MPAIGMLALTYWKPIAFAIAITAALAYRGVLVHQRDSAQATVATMAAQLDGLKAAEAACEDAVARQNQAVAAIKANAERAAAAAASHQANVASAAAISAAEEDRRAAAMAREPVATDCAGAIRWGNAQARELGKWRLP
jgi:hypothetical protein